MIGGATDVAELGVYKLKKLVKAQRLIIGELHQVIERRDRGEESDDE